LSQTILNKLLLKIGEVTFLQLIILEQVLDLEVDIFKIGILEAFGLNFEGD